MAHIMACPRVELVKVVKLLPEKYYQSLEQNQQISSCCRHPENHEIEAFYSCDEIKTKGVPDIYKNYCTCGRTHVRFCVGECDIRPFWEVR